MPRKLLDMQRRAAAIFYDGFHGGGPVLSRPDQHVAWRGDTVPADALALIDRVRGAASHGSGAGSGHAVPIA